MILKNNSVKHGLSNTPAYRRLKSMIGRCTNKNDKSYKNYGGRGIKVCDRWLGEQGIINFLKDMGDKPKGMTLDRVNNNGDYSPENCKWVTPIEQCNNRRGINIITYKNKEKTLTQWCEELNLNRKTVSARIHKTKWTHEKALSTPTNDGFKRRR